MSRMKRTRTRKKRDERRSNCPISCSLDIIGDKWTLLVVRDLLNGKRRYGEFLESPEGVPTNILAERLKRLEANGIVVKQLYSKRPPRAEYQITARGEALAEIVYSLSAWGLQHLENTQPLETEALSVEPAAPVSSDEQGGKRKPLPVEEAVAETTSMPEPVPAAEGETGHDIREHEVAAAAAAEEPVAREEVAQPAYTGNGEHDHGTAPEANEDAAPEAKEPEPQSNGEEPPADNVTKDEAAQDEVRPGQEEKDDSQLSLF